MPTHVQSTVLKKIKTGTGTGTDLYLPLDDRFLGATIQSAGFTLYYITYTYYCNLQIFTNAATLCGNCSWYSDYIEDSSGFTHISGARDVDVEGVITYVTASQSTPTRTPYFNVSTISTGSYNYVLYVDCFISEFV
jgi:hypothetical protein